MSKPETKFMFVVQNVPNSCERYVHSHFTIAELNIIIDQAIKIDLDRRYWGIRLANDISEFSKAIDYACVNQINAVGRMAGHFNRWPSRLAG